MTTLSRYWWKIGALLLLLIGVGILQTSARMSLHDPAFITGFSLLACLAVLTLFNIRKKFPMLPLGRVANWTHIHILMGWFTVGLFLLHIGFNVPDGALEIVVALLFAAVAISGIIGGLISKIYPQRLTTRGQEVILERIPEFRQKLKSDADELALASIEKTGGRTIADFYSSRVMPFLREPENQIVYRFGGAKSPHKLLADMNAVCRYLDDCGQEIILELSEIVRQKDALDFHQSLQWALKIWLFVHIPLTYSLWILVLLHMVVAMAYTGGLL
jgi:hypothetical protein